MVADNTNSNPALRQTNTEQVRHSVKPAALFAVGACLIFLMLAGCVGSASSTDNGLPSAPGGNLFLGSGGSYAPLIDLLIVGLATMSLIVAVIYMVASLLRQPEWEAFLKTELYQMLVSVLWGVFLISAAFVVDGVTTQMAHQSLFDAAQGYLSHVICLSETATIKMEGLKIFLQYLAGMKSQWYAGQWGFSTPTFAGFDVLERAVDLIQTLVLPFTSSLFVQSLILDVIHSTALVFLLPVGVLMRIAPPTREAGSFLIAAAFGLYFILPFTYLISAQVMNQLYEQDYGYAMCSSSVGQTNSYLGTSTFYDTTATKLLPSISEDFIGNGSFTHSLSYIAIQAVFLPSLAMVIVVSFIRSATKFFSQKMD